MQKINLHSLVVTTEEDSYDFPLIEKISFTQTLLSLCGNTDITTWDHIIGDEILRQTDIRLRMGRRVVLCMPRVSKYQWDKLQKIADIYDVDLYYSDLLAQQFEVSGSVLESTRTVIAPVSANNIQNFSDLLVIGDVHGNYNQFQSAVDFAKTHGLLLISLGDLIDYGNQNLKCIKLMYNLYKEGSSIFVLGNHEKKLSKWIDSGFGRSYKGKLSSSNLVTTSEILGLSPPSLSRFSAAWNALYSGGFQHMVIGDWMFVHGACTPEMWHNTSHRLHGISSNFAFYGQVDNDNPRIDGYPRRIWDWTSDIPAGKNVVVGHDWLDRINNNITTMTNNVGGKTFAVDCGSSKGGRLAGLKINTKTNDFTVHYFDDI